MLDYQEKILNYLLFFLLSLTGLASLLLVKNNHLYLFVFIFLILYWQRDNATRLLSNYLKSQPSFLTFLTLGMVGVLLFQVFSGSPRFAGEAGSARFFQRPVLTLIISLIFYLPYFFLWYRFFLRRKNAVLETFFFAGLGGILVFGLLSGKLTTTVLTAPNLASGFFYVLLKAAGILTVVGALTAFPFLFFSDKRVIPQVEGVEKKNNSGFGLIEILVGVSLFLAASGVVGVARQRQNIAKQKLEQVEQSRLGRIENLKQKVKKQKEETSPPIKEAIPTPTNTPKIPKDQVGKSDDQPRKSIKEGEVKQPRPQTSKDEDSKDEDFYDDFYDQVATYDTCQANPSIPGCEAYYYDPYEDPNSPEYQQRLDEEWYYQQQNPDELFFNDPMQLLNQNPVLYEMFENIYNFEPIPGLPSIFGF